MLDALAVPNMQVDTSLIGSREACRLLDVDKSTLSRWAANGTLVPAQQLPGKNGAMLFNRAEVEALAAARSAS